MTAPLTAALDFAGQGLPVFPCNPRNKTPLLGTDKDAQGNAIRGTGGVSKAVTFPEQIKAWWKKWPQAMVGVATGHDRVFVLDFDPRTDDKTGEVFTLDRLKADLEAQMGCALPLSRTSITQSGGVHVWLRWPDDGGAEIRNRGNLPLHVDVRGKGGYVIAPPSVMESGKAYRWAKGRGPDVPIADAPAALVEILRTPGKGKAAPAGGSKENRTAPARPTRTVGDDPRKAAIDKYAENALQAECKAVRDAPSGARNQQLNASAFAVASLVAAGAIEAGWARAMIETAARSNPGRDDDGQLMATIDSGWQAGLGQPRDLSAIGTRAAPPRASSRASASAATPRPASDGKGRPSSHAGGGAGRLPAKRGAGGDVRRDVMQECAFRPMTDMGNLERFLMRFGDDFRHVQAWGWMAWDGCRWNREKSDALLGNAIRETVRAIQDEAALIAGSGVLIEDDISRGDYDALRGQCEGVRLIRMDDDEATDMRTGEVVQDDVAKACFDRLVQVKRDGTVVLYSHKVAAWGRTSEGAGHIACLNSPSMLQAALNALPDDFDPDPLRLNVENGTLIFARGEGGRATVDLRPHDRADMITKMAAAAYDPEATSPAYDAFLDRVQPEADMQHFLDCWAGYSALGDVSGQVFALFYGQGANGKSVWVDAHAHVLGDYARVCGIETFIDQGRYRKGSDATPDLAALAGRRMVRASEPEEGTKFSDGLIKALTGTEPVPVRELNKPPFEMNVTFKVTVSANVKPRIGTDHGIQRRVRLVPWDVIIPPDEQDRQLLTKLKAEASGILNRMVAGAVAFLGKGLPMPDAIEAATREYREENDLLGRFLTDCVAEEKGGEVGASALHSLFSAWQRFVGQLDAKGNAWSVKYLGNQMKKKGYRQKKSSTMVWLDIKLSKSETDYAEPPSPGDYDDYA